MNRARLLLLAVVFTVVIATPTSAAQTRLFLPLIGASGTPTPQYQVNVPVFPDAVVDDRFGELAIFWFGAVDPTSNYADVRVGANADGLYIYTAIFDRHLWFDREPQPADLAKWDAVTLYIADAADPSSRRRFVAQLSEGGDPAYQAAYTAGPAGWAPAAIPFTTQPGWRGDRLNDNNDSEDRGWAMTFRLPFSSFGLAERPADGTRWRIAMTLHDRDDAAGAPIPDQFWPPNQDPGNSQTWGVLHFGMPAYTPPPAEAPETVRLRHGEGGVVVPDAAVGGGAICGDDVDFWAEWGNSSRNAGNPDFNIQNQIDVADWPCFSKYYVTFPLDGLPRGRTIISAELVLHHFGNAQPADATPSLIQIHTIDRDWVEADLTWNNAPLATENVGAGWVPPLPDFAGWPGVPRRFDVARATAQAYAAGTPLQLALYAADRDYHSGKYFVSSDTGDWNAEGRPTLIITLGR